MKRKEFKEKENFILDNLNPRDRFLIKNAWLILSFPILLISLLWIIFIIIGWDKLEIYNFANKNWIFFIFSPILYYLITRKVYFDIINKINKIIRNSKYTDSAEVTLIKYFSGKWK